ANPYDPYKYQDKNDPGVTDYFSNEGSGFLDKFLAAEDKRQANMRAKDAAEGDSSRAQGLVDKRLDDAFAPADAAQPATEVTAQVEGKQSGGLRDRIRREMFTDPFGKKKRKAGDGQFLDALMSTTTY
ncbi:MAG: hypothetical protein WBM08_12535, partial [Prochlorococcaceae cyanobacterium]